MTKLKAHSESDFTMEDNLEYHGFDNEASTSQAAEQITMNILIIEDNPTYE